MKDKNILTKTRTTYGYSDYYYITYKDGSFEFVPVQRGKTPRAKKLNKKLDK